LPGRQFCIAFGFLYCAQFGKYADFRAASSAISDSSGDRRTFHGVESCDTQAREN
jgi:hypothetical protein